MRLWRVSLLVLGAALVVVVGVVLAGVGSGLVLLAYVLLVAALLIAWLVGRLSKVLPLAPNFQRSLARPDPEETRVEQFETVKQSVVLAGSSRSDLFGLRPLVREVVAARLSRRYGIDLEREPERVKLLVGEGRTWELLRPDAPTRTDRDAPGWSQHELEQLVEELESL